MFSTTIKRSVATLGVVAGLLAAAGPASAQGGGADPTRGPQELGFRVEMGSLPCARAVDGGDDQMKYYVETACPGVRGDKGQNARTNPSFTIDVDMGTGEMPVVDPIYSSAGVR